MKKFKKPYRIFKASPAERFELFFPEMRHILLYKNHDVVLRFKDVCHVMNIPNECIYIEEKSGEPYKVPSELFDEIYSYPAFYQERGLYKEFVERHMIKDVVPYDIVKNYIPGRWLIKEKDLFETFKIVNDFYNYCNFELTIDLNEKSDNYLKPCWVKAKGGILNSE